jgi:peptidoglycan/LPS O-acetylase OafA/YrhL
MPAAVWQTGSSMVPPMAGAAISSVSATHRDRILDAWRGLSVLLVVLAHCIDNSVPWSAFGVPIASHRPSDALIGYAWYTGQLGVQCFFVISGYFITMLLLREHARNGGVSLLAFYVRRAFRILPALWLMLAVVAVFNALGVIAVSPASFMLSSTFLCDVEAPHCGWFVVHTWSLAVEEQFYLLWPLLLIALNFRRLPQLALILSITLLLVSQVYLRHIGSGHPDYAMSFACIVTGCLYATSGRLKSWVASSASRLPVLLLLAAFIAVRPLIPMVFAGQDRLELLLHPWAVCFVMFGCFQYRQALEGSRIVRALAGFGLISYGVYLWQQLFLGESTEYLKPSILSYALLTLVFAWLSYLLVERPMIRIGSRLSRSIIDARLAARGRVSSSERRATTDSPPEKPSAALSIVHPHSSQQPDRS